MANEDSVWKEVLDTYFREFLEFFFPEIHRDIDWSGPVEFFDKELEPLLADSEIGKRLADKLAKVFLLDGGEEWLLIHVEVQGTRESDFPERMFVYNVKIFLHFHKEVVSLALLTDDEESWRPDTYGRRRWRYAHVMQFPMVKLLDYRDRWAELEASPNPFAVVVMAHLKARETRLKDEERYHAKVTLIRMLYKQGREREDVIQLFRFIDWLLRLPKELETETRLRVAQLEGVKTMPYVTSFERLAKEEGFEEGLSKGRKEGIKEGLLEALELGLELRYGKESLRLLGQIRQVTDVEELRKLKSALMTAKSVEEFEGHLPSRGAQG